MYRVFKRQWRTSEGRSFIGVKRHITTFKCKNEAIKFCEGWNRLRSIRERRLAIKTEFEEVKNESFLSVR